MERNVIPNRPKECEFVQHRYFEWESSREALP